MLGHCALGTKAAEQRNRNLMPWFHLQVGLKTTLSACNFFSRPRESVNPDHVSRVFCFLFMAMEAARYGASSDCFDLTAENPGPGRLWTRSVSSSTLQQLQSLGTRRRRSLAKCRWVWKPDCGFRLCYSAQKSGSPDAKTVLSHVGDPGRSNHQRQPPAGGLWECQDCEERQLVPLCESLIHCDGHRWTTICGKSLM